MEEHGGELQGGLEPRCRGDRVFVFDPTTNTSAEAVGLRGVPVSYDWSPDGSRLLHPARTTEAREVTRATGGNSLQIWPARAVPTPRSTALHACGPTVQFCNQGSSRSCGSVPTC